MKALEMVAEIYILKKELYSQEFHYDGL